MAPQVNRRKRFKVDITPSVDSLLSKRNSEMTAAQCFGEFIDNSIDARQQIEGTCIRIAVNMDAATVTVEDNGGGMDSAASCLQSGRHVATTDKQGSSRYGVGLKDAGWRLGESFTVDSVKDGKRTRAVADSEKIRRRGKWLVTEAVGRSNKPNGTRIIVERVDFPLTANAMVRVRTELAKVYADAIRAGVRIEINGVVLEAEPPPRLRTQREVEILICDGKKRFRVVGGILCAGQESTQNGVTISLPFRTICRGERFGFEGYDTSEFYAHVVLLEDKSRPDSLFRVSDHKNTLYEKTAICREVARAFADMLKPQSHNHVINLPIPKAAKEAADESLIQQAGGDVAVSSGEGDVGNQHGNGKGSNGKDREKDPPGLFDDPAGSKSAKPKKKRGYDIDISFKTCDQTIAECTCGEKQAKVVLGGESQTFLNYADGRDRGQLRDTVAMAAVAISLCVKSNDDPKTPLDVLICDSDKPQEKILRTVDNIINHWKTNGRG